MGKDIVSIAKNMSTRIRNVSPVRKVSKNFKGPQMTMACIEKTDLK